MIHSLEGGLYKRAIFFLYGDRAEIDRHIQRVTGSNKGEKIAPSAVGNYKVWQRPSGFEIDFISVVQTGPLRTRIATLAHEVNHHAHYLFRDVLCTKLTEDSEEAYCYYAEWVLAQCLKVMMPDRRRARAKASSGTRRSEGSGSQGGATRRSRARGSRQGHGA